MRLNLSSEIVLNKVPLAYYKPKTTVEQKPKTSSATTPKTTTTTSPKPEEKPKAKKVIVE